MTSLATPADLATYLQTATQAEADAGSPNVLDTAVAQQALDAASAKIRGAAGWHISPPEPVTRTLTPGAVSVYLPSMRVADVVLTSNGQPLVEGTYLVDLDGCRVDFNHHWVFGGPVVITYSSGYAETPEAIKALCLEIAAGIYSNPGNALSVTYGSVTENYRPPATAANPEDLRVDHRLAPFVIMAFA